MKLPGTALQVQFLHNEGRGVFPPHKCTATTITAGNMVSMYPGTDRSTCEICSTVEKSLPATYYATHHSGGVPVVGERGTTTCLVKNIETHEVVAAATAFCQKPDRYERVKGKRVAFAKALRRSGFTRKDRVQLAVPFEMALSALLMNASLQRAAAQEAEAKRLAQGLEKA